MRIFRLLFALLVLGLVAACAGATTNLPTIAPAESGAASVTTTTTFGTLPTSRTPAGYHVLGNADAPITIEHFSDFL